MLLFILSGFSLFIVLYYLVSALLWITLDSDIELFLKAKFGKKISSLCGKVVWITGASSGLGKSLAILLASHGVKLVLSARRLDELQKVREECLQVSGGKLQKHDVLALRLDVLDLEKHEEVFKKIIKHFGHLDVLVNNAGRSMRADWLDIDIAVDKAMFELDVFSPIHLSRIVAKYFVNNRIDGQIAVTSSFASLSATPNMSSYVAAKSALNGYFHALNMDYPQIRTVLYCVGPFFSEVQLEAFTARDGEKCGMPLKATDKRMSSERTAFHFGIAIANEIPMSWAGPYPFTLLVYLRNYPLLHNFAQNFINWNKVCKPKD